MREAGAVPATTGVLDGRIRVGLDDDELERFTSAARKVGPSRPRRAARLAATSARRRSAASSRSREQSASASWERAGSAASIAATRRRPTSRPTSSRSSSRPCSSPARARSRCSTSRRRWSTSRRSASPCSASARTRCRSSTRRRAGRPCRSASTTRETAPRIAAAHWQLGGCGLLLANPPPESLDVEELIEEAVAEAARQGVSGQAVTPFVLARLHERSGGRTRDVNRKLVGRQRAARRRGRGSVRRPVSLYDAVKDLPLAIEGYDLDVARARRARADFTRKTTTITTRRGAARRGSARTSPTKRPSTTPSSSAARSSRSPATWTLDSFSAAPREHAAVRARARAPRVPRLPPLGLRERRARPRAAPGGQSLGEAVGRELRPLTFVVSMRSASRRRLDRLRGWLELYPSLRFKLDATSDWTDELVAELAALGCVDSIDFKGHYRGTVVDQGARSGALPARRRGPSRRLARGPGARRTSTMPILEPRREQVTWDAIIHSVEDIEALPWPPRDREREAVALRLGASSSSPPTTTARSAGSARTAAGSSSSASGRGHIQLPRGALPSGHAERRRAAAASTSDPRPGLPDEPAHGRRRARPASSPRSGASPRGPRARSPGRRSGGGRRRRRARAARARERASPARAGRRSARRRRVPRSAAIRVSASSGASTTCASSTSLVATGSAGDVEVHVHLGAHVLADVADDRQPPASGASGRRPRPPCPRAGCRARPGRPSKPSSPGWRSSVVVGRGGAGARRS